MDAQITIAAMNIAFILNGAKKSSVRIADEMERLCSGKHEVSFHFTKSSGDAKSISSEVALQNDLIFAVGGDGTLSDCVNGLLTLKEKNVSANLSMLSVLPFGSGNDFARNFSGSNLLADFVQRIENGKQKPVDAGRIICGEQVGYFINETSLGITTEVVERVNASSKPFGATVAFLSSSVSAMMNFKKQEVEVRSENFSFKGRAMAVVIANGKWFGSGLCIAPEAKVDDGIFDITVVGNVSVFDYLKCLPDLRKGKMIRHKAVHYSKSSWVEVSGNAQMERDGELGMNLPVKIEVIKNALRWFG